MDFPSLKISANPLLQLNLKYRSRNGIGQEPFGVDHVGRQYTTNPQTISPFAADNGEYDTVPFRPHFSIRKRIGQ